jgi:hypothetical protein
MRITCRLAGVLPPDVAGGAVFRGHRARCLRCQADEVRTRGLVRDLASLRAEVLPAPPGLHSAVMARLDEPPRAATAARRAMQAKVAAIVGAAMAAVAVIGGVALRRLHHAR